VSRAEHETPAPKDDRDSCRTVESFAEHEDRVDGVDGYRRFDGSRLCVKRERVDMGRMWCTATKIVLVKVDDLKADGRSRSRFSELVEWWRES
jgi:hypothetical protein